jgi:hypothetical protein
MGGLKISDFITEIKTIIGADVVALIGVTQKYYIQVGTTVMVVVIIEAIYLSIAKYIIDRLSRNSLLRSAKKPSKTIAFIKSSILSYQTDFAIKFAVLDYFILMSLIFGGILPVVTIGAFIYIAISYPLIKTLFINRSKSPEPLRTSTVMSSIRVGYFGVLCRLVVNIFAYSDTTVWPYTSQFNVAQFSLKDLASSSSMARLSNVSVYVILLILWIVYLIVHAIVFTVIHLKNMKSVKWMSMVIREIEPHLEENEGQNNYISRRDEISAYVLPTYAMFKNPDNAILKAAFMAVVYR